MSDAIVRWLNADVGLSKQVTAGRDGATFERDFANGYLFGEVLSKYGLVQNFEDDFIDQQNFASKKQNFAALQSALNGSAKFLGIRLKDEQVMEIMNEDRGTSLRLLFQLRKGLGQLDKPAATGLAKSHLQQSHGRTARPVEDNNAERFFESQLAPLRRGDPRVNYELHTKRFVDEHTQQMQKAMVSVAKEEQTKLDHQKDFRDARLVKMQKVHADAAVLQEAGVRAWRGTVQRKWATVEKDLLLEKDMAVAEQQRIEHVRLKRAQDAGYAEGEDGYGIGWFEKNLQRIGIDTSDEAGLTEPTITAATAKELYQKMGEKLPTKAQMEIESHNRLKRIKETKVVTDKARLERERRRRKGQVEQHELQQDVEKQKQEEDLLAWLNQEADTARKEAKAYDVEQRCKQAQRFKRESEQKARAEVMDQKMQAALQSTAESALAQRRAQAAETVGPHEAAFSDSSDEESEDKQQPAASAASRGKRLSFVDFRNSATKGWNESRAASVANKDSQADAPLGAEDLVSTLSEPFVAEYIFMRGGWERHTAEALGMQALPAAGATSPGPGIGSLARWLCQQPPVKSRRADVPPDYIPLVALLGSPLSYGHSTLREFADSAFGDYNYATLNTEEILVEAWSHCRKPAETVAMDWPPLARVCELAQSFSSAQDGEDVQLQPDLVAELLFRKIELLSAPPPPKPSESPQDDDKKKKAKPPAKKKDVEEKKEPDRPQGVVLLDFPVDLGQCHAWFRALCGYGSPLLQQLGTEQDFEAQVTAVLAPWWLEDGWTPSSAEVASAAAQPDPGPIEVLCLEETDHSRMVERLGRAMVAETLAEETKAAADAAAAAEAAKHAHKEKKSHHHDEEVVQPQPPNMRCHGLGGELAHQQSQVDRMWLFSQGQASARAFLQEQGCAVKVLQPPSAPSPEGAESPDGLASGQSRPPSAAGVAGGPDVYRNLVKGEMERIVAARAAAAEAAAAEAEARAALEGTANEQLGEETGRGEVGGEDSAVNGPPRDGSVADTSPDAEDAPAVDEDRAEQEGFELGAPALPLDKPWTRVSTEVRLEMREAWMTATTGYLHGLQSTLKELSSLSIAYGDAVANMQQKFLDKLQTPDAKGTALTEWLQTWPTRAAAMSQEEVYEKLEQISDKLWQFADQRLGEAVEERLNLMEGSFWYERAMAVMEKVVALQSFEYSRFRCIAEILTRTYMEAGAVRKMELPPDLDELDEFGEKIGQDRSDIEDLLAWLYQITQMFVNIPLRGPGEEVGFADGLEQLHAVLVHEKKKMNARVCMLQSWAADHLREMRSQLDEVFSRMDDWIRDRVWLENDAIKTTIAAVKALAEPTAADPSTGTSLSDRRHARHGAGTRPGLDSEPSSPFAGSPRLGASAVRKNKEVVRLLEPKPLAAEIYSPIRPPVPQPVQAVESRASDVDPNRWSQDMLTSLMSVMLQRPEVALSTEDVFNALSRQWHCTFRLQEKLVPPAWASRRVNAMQLMCKNLVAPGWGVERVDVLEFMLTLTFHSRHISWPTTEALEASRKLVEQRIDDPYAFPDVPISEAMFVDLPLWGASVEAKLQGEPSPDERLMNIKRWIFQLMMRFERSSSAGSADQEISARRLFSYLALGTTPSTGLLRSLKSMLPKAKPKPVVEEPPVESEPVKAEPKPEPKKMGRAPSKSRATDKEKDKKVAASRSGSKASMASQASDGHKVEEEMIHVKDLWRCLFCEGRHAGTETKPRPSLEQFHASLKQAVEELSQARTEAVAASAADKKGKNKQAKGATPQPPEDERLNGLMTAQPEEAVIAYNEHKLLQNPAIARALSEYGALLCRTRAVETLYPPDGFMGLTSPDSDMEGLRCLIPPPQAVSPDPPSEDMLPSASKAANKK